MVTVPAETPVTNPVPETVAIAGSEETHGFAAAGVPVPFSCVVAPIQTDNVPEIVAPEVIVTAWVTEHPSEFV